MKDSICINAFHRVLNEIRLLRGQGNSNYWVPHFLVDSDAELNLVDVGDAYSFYINVFDEIEAFSNSIKIKKECEQNSISEKDVIYLTFMRTFASLNNEIGTPLKQIAFLTHLLRMKVNILLTLPTGKMGYSNRKGQRGSPFAVTDPFSIDSSFIDPLLPNIDAITQYQALVGACILVGIQCGSIVPCAGISLDSPLIRRFPEITYWWDMPIGSELQAPIKHCSIDMVGEPDIADHQNFEMNEHFHEPPPPNKIFSVMKKDSLFWYSENGLTPATSCPDVLGDESGTYSWGDIAEVRFGDALVPDVFTPSETNSFLRNRASQIMALAIAWRVSILGESIIWVDVAERVPVGVLELASALTESWDMRSEYLCRIIVSTNRLEDIEEIGRLLDEVTESCSIDPPKRIRFIAEELYSFQRQSLCYDAVVGPWVFCVSPFTHDLNTFRESIRYHLKLLSQCQKTVTFLAGLGDHDTTPPEPKLVAGLIAFSWLLPGGIPLIFSGHEYASQVVVNKEFGFNTTTQLREWRAKLTDCDLALFNDILIPWQELSFINERIKVIQQILELKSVFSKYDLVCFESEKFYNQDIVGYSRRTSEGQGFSVYLNTNPIQSCRIEISHEGPFLYSTERGEIFKDKSNVNLAPFETVVSSSIIWGL